MQDKPRSAPDHQNVSLVSNEAMSLVIRQQPIRARSCGSGDKPDRRPIDPPPILQLIFHDSNTACRVVNSLVLCYASVVEADSLKPINSFPHILFGTTVSSIYYLKNSTSPELSQRIASNMQNQNHNHSNIYDNKRRTNRDMDKLTGYFVFDDLSLRTEGTFKLLFTVYERQLEHTNLVPILRIISDTFTVYSAKKFPGMIESSELCEKLAEQGVRIRIRKDTRFRRRSSAKSSCSSLNFVSPSADSNNIEHNCTPISRSSNENNMQIEKNNAKAGSRTYNLIQNTNSCSVQPSLFEGNQSAISYETQSAYCLPNSNSNDSTRPLDKKIERSLSVSSLLNSNDQPDMHETGSLPLSKDLNSIKASEDQRYSLDDSNALMNWPRQDARRYSYSSSGFISPNYYLSSNSNSVSCFASSENYPSKKKSSLKSLRNDINGRQFNDIPIDQAQSTDRNPTRDSSIPGNRLPSLNELIFHTP